MNDFLPHQELSPHLWCMHYASRTGKKMEATEQACTQPHLGAWLRVHAFILQRWCRREGLWVEVGPRQRCRSPSLRCTCYTNTEEKAWRPTPNAGRNTMSCALCAQQRHCRFVRVYNLLLFRKGGHLRCGGVVICDPMAWSSREPSPTSGNQLLQSKRKFESFSCTELRSCMY
jgi:hypothetical protein